MKTKERILNVAEILFAENGFEKVSVREIVNQAKANIAAVNYHFGSKEDLIMAVIKRRLVSVNDVRRTELEKLQNHYAGKSIPVQELLFAFIHPAFQLSIEDRYQGYKFIQLMGRIVSNQGPVLKEKICSMFQNVVSDYLAELIKSVPSQSEQEIASRFYFAISSMCHVLLNQASPDSIKEILGISEDLNLVARQLSIFCSEGFSSESTAIERYDDFEYSPAAS